MKAEDGPSDKKVVCNKGYTGLGKALMGRQGCLIASLLEISYQRT